MAQGISIDGEPLGGVGGAYFNGGGGEVAHADAATNTSSGFTSVDVAAPTQLQKIAKARLSMPASRSTRVIPRRIIW
jgi:hypothetical protein